MNERMQAARSEDTFEIATPADVTAVRGDRRRLAVVPQDVFLSTAAPRRWDWRLAVAVALVSIVGLTLAAPYASYRWPVTPSFIAAYEAAMLVSDLITAILLVGQFRQVRRVGVLIVGCGYLFTAVIVAVHALSFPEVFSATGLLGTSRQATVWLYVMWHGIFPVFVCAYALIHGSRWNEPLAPHRTGPAIMIGTAVAVGIATGCTLLTTWGIDLLPEVIRGNDYKRVVTSGIAPAAWSISLVALALLWVRTRGRSVLDLWLMVVMVAWLLDIFLSTLISTVRYDFGWYGGRIYGLMAASFVLGALLLEANLLYGRLACSLTDAREKNAALEKQTAELARLHENAMRDITERKRHEGALHEKNVQLQAAVSELDAFSYSVSHDLRAPLRAIDGFSRILLKQYGSILPQEPREYLQLVRDNTVQMGHLVDDLLAFARLSRQQLSKQRVPTRKIVESVLSDARQQAEGRSVSVSVGELPSLWGDPPLLKQVFVNLIGNAFKYTRMRGEAVIEVGSREIGGEQVVFVRDNGAGFDMRYADKLFGVFQRLHRAEDFEGTGVGLAIVQRIVHRHGGRVWAEAAVDQGATFYFTTGVSDHD
jgi:signal transduction histidine kinase